MSDVAVTVDATEIAVSVTATVVESVVTVEVSGPTGEDGTSDHSELTNLAWINSGHISGTTGTYKFAGFGPTGEANTFSFGTTGIDVCVGNDSRLSDSRTPTAHKTSHAIGGSDALAPGDIGAQPAGSYAASSHTHPSADLPQSLPLLIATTGGTASIDGTPVGSQTLVASSVTAGRYSFSGGTAPYTCELSWIAGEWIYSVELDSNYYEWSITSDALDPPASGYTAGSGADGSLAISLNTPATPPAGRVTDATISGTTTIASGATWSYASATEKTAHLDALGFGAAGKAIAPLTTPAAVVAYLDKQITAYNRSTVTATTQNQRQTVLTVALTTGEWIVRVIANALVTASGTWDFEVTSPQWVETNAAKIGTRIIATTNAQLSYDSGISGVKLTGGQGTAQAVVAHFIVNMTSDGTLTLSLYNSAAVGSVSTTVPGAALEATKL